MTKSKRQSSVQKVGLSCNKPPMTHIGECLSDESRTFPCKNCDSITVGGVNEATKPDDYSINKEREIKQLELEVKKLKSLLIVEHQRNQILENDYQNILSDLNSLL